MGNSPCCTCFGDKNDDTVRIIGEEGISRICLKIIIYVNIFGFK